MGRLDPTQEWKDERLRTTIEDRVDVLEQQIRKHVRAQYDNSMSGAQRESAAHDAVILARDSIVEWIYLSIRGEVE